MKCPTNLSNAARLHWQRITREYELTSDAAMILETGLASWDMGQDARALLRKDGLVLGTKRHPALEIVKMCDTVFLRAMRELGLNISDPGDVGRPPESLRTRADVDARGGPQDDKQVLLF